MSEELTQEELEAISEEFEAHLDELQDAYGVELDQEQINAITAASVRNGFTPESTARAFTEGFINDAIEDYEAQTGRTLSKSEIQQVGDLALENRDNGGVPDVGGVLQTHDRLANQEQQAQVEPDDDLVRTYFDNELNELSAANEEWEDDQEEAEDAALWELSFDNGVASLERELGRELLAKERDQLRDKLPGETEGELDVVGVWKTTVGRNGDPYDQDTASGRRQWMTERHREKAEPPPATVEKPADDAPRQERQDFMAARMNGAEIAEPEQTSEPAEQEA